MSPGTKKSKTLSFSPRTGPKGGVSAPPTRPVLPRPVTTPTVKVEMPLRKERVVKEEDVSTFDFESVQDEDMMNVSYMYMHVVFLYKNGEFSLSRFW